MDKLEQYLDQVCRCLGGPRSMRQHVRQELREHLLDAVAQHHSAGLTEADALERALNEFGKPEDVRSEMEAAHGQRVMAVAIEKAIEWKEMTMKAKWLWTTWANLSLALVIAMEVFFIFFVLVYIHPKFQKLLGDGMIDAAALDEHGLSWMPAFLMHLRGVGGEYALPWLLLAGGAWGLCEWRVRSENKPFMRLSAFGTAAVGLMVLVALTTASLVIPFCLALPMMGQLARPFAEEQVARIDLSVKGLQVAMEKKDWHTMWEQTNQASDAMNRLGRGPAVTALRSSNEPLTVEELRAHLKAANEILPQMLQAIGEKDTGQLETALQKFRTLYGPVRDAAKKPKR